MLKLPSDKGFYVYILECMDHSYYTGWTTDLNHRFHLHKMGKGARYTKSHPPVSIVYFETFLDQRSAMEREYAIKQLTRKQKEQLIKEMQETLE